MTGRLTITLVLATALVALAAIQALAAVGSDMVARATEIPSCAVYVDAASPANGKGSAEQPWQRMLRPLWQQIPVPSFALLKALIQSS